MRFSIFSHGQPSEPELPSHQEPPPMAAAPQPRSGKTFPADEIVWGIVIRNGFDEMDDPWYHRGTTQHAYLEGNDNVAICGFRPPQSGPRTRRRSRLGLPTPGEHPMCGMCARMVVAPRPRVPVAVQPVRPAVAVPVTGGVPPLPRPMPVTPRTAVAAAGPGRAVAGVPTAPQPRAAQPMQPPPAGGTSTSPWVRRAGGDQAEGPAVVSIGSSHDGGLMARGIHADTEA